MSSSRVSSEILGRETDLRHALRLLALHHAPHLGGTSALRGRRSRPAEAVCYLAYCHGKSLVSSGGSSQALEALTTM